MRRHPPNMHVQVSSVTISLNFSFVYYPYLYFASSASSDGSDETVQARLSIRCSHMQYVAESHELACVLPGNMIVL